MRRKAAPPEVENNSVTPVRDPLEGNDDDETKHLSNENNNGHTGDSLIVGRRNKRVLEADQRRHHRGIFRSSLIALGILHEDSPRVIRRLEYPHLQPKQSRRLLRRQDRMDVMYYVGVLLSLFCLVAGIIFIIETSVQLITPKRLPRTVIISELEFQPSSTLRRTSPPKRQSPHHYQGDELLVHYFGKGRLTRPRPVVDDDFLNSKDSEDYGEIQAMQLRFLEHDGMSRNIYQQSSDKKGHARPLSDSRDDDYDNFFSFDDDAMRSPYNAFDDDNLMKNSRCRRPSWYRFQAPVCNILHELDVPTSIGKFYGQGSFRDVFSAFHNFANGTEKIVYKEIKLERDLDYIDMENVRTDAMVAEMFSSHPRFVDMYAYCGFSQLTEVFEHGDVEKAIVGYRRRREGLDPLAERQVKSRNDFSPSAKLKLALEMVEALNALHTEKDAVIVHDDVDLGQFLWTDHDMREMKLNDFNRAEVMLWDEVNNQFCKFKNGGGGGWWRSPEEYKDGPLSDKIDVYSVGNNMYSLLTGLYPFFEIEDVDDAQEMVMEGRTPTIDPRYESSSYAEAQLVQIIRKCWIYNPDDRPYMAEVERMLKEAIVEDGRLRVSVGGPLPPRQ